MIHKEFWGLLFLGFIAWVFIAASPQSRIEHACRPIGWGGNVVTSLTAMVTPAHQSTMQRWFDKFEYGCQYTAWRLFYQKDYNAWLKAQAAQDARNAEADTLLKGEAPDDKKEAAPGGPPSRDAEAAPVSPIAPPVRKAGEGA